MTLATYHWQVLAPMSWTIPEWPMILLAVPFPVRVSAVHELSQAVGCDSRFDQGPVMPSVLLMISAGNPRARFCFLNWLPNAPLLVAHTASFLIANTKHSFCRVLIQVRETIPWRDVTPRDFSCLFKHESA